MTSSRCESNVLDAVIVGAGFAGIGAAAELLRRGIDDFVILERAADVGGVWRDNTYPGCRCDVPSSLYSFSFLSKSDWSDRFAGQPEIQAYLKKSVRDLGLDSHLRLNCDVAQATWESASQRWQVATSTGDSITARMLIVGSGALNEPTIPKIDGLNSFEGELFHSSQWPTDFEPGGKRIAVIGTGASAVQLVPQIVQSARQVTIYQRTAPWIVPRGDREIPGWRQKVHAWVPATMLASRGFDFTRRELMTNSFVKSGRLLGMIERAGRRHIARQVSDARLRSQVTPNFRAGCKRIIMSDDWYPALQRANVELVTDPIGRISATGIETRSAKDPRDFREFDAVVLATGFRVQRRSILSQIIGADGKSIAATMILTEPTAYLGSTVPGFPNLVLMTGPNTGLANNSMILMIEAQARYAGTMASYLAGNPEVALDVRSDVVKRFSAELDHRLGGSVWSAGGCSSWYQDGSGRVTALWPGTTTEYRRRTRRLELGDYEQVPRVGRE